MTPQKDLENPTSFGVAETKENSSDTSDSMDITKAGRENVQSYLNPFQSGNEIHPGTAAGDKGTSIPFLSESALYSLHPEETATYLVETDPAFTNKHRFLSSDYMYRQMTWDPDRVTKRLGDGFYEQELVRQQVAGLTGMRYLNGYTDDEEEYKALMDAGIAYAKEYGLKPGISLTKEQMASLTSDMVWLETTKATVNGKTYEVLYPKVYLKPGTMTLTSDGSLISADTLVAETKETLENNASILGNTVVLKGNDVVNLGSILGKDIALKAERDVIQKGLITGEDRAALTAGRDISMGNTILHGRSQDILDTTAGIAVKGKEGVLLMESGRDIHLTGATLEALGDKGSMILSAGHNLTMDTDTLEARKDMTEDRDNYIRTYRKTETSNTLAAGKDITLTTENHVSIRNAVIASKNGAVTAAAKGDVTVTNGYNEARDDYGLKYKEKGLLSSKTTAIRSHDEEKKASLTILSGDTVSILSGKDTRISGSQVIADHNVTAAAGGNVHISSAHEYEAYDYEKQTKKSGILSGGSLGFTIGSEKRKDRYDSTGLTERGSILGSAEGNVFLTSGKELTVEASALAAGKNLALKGQNVTITSRDNVYTNKEEHEYKRSGINIFLGGSTFNVLSDVAVPIENAANTHDAKLKALYGYDAYKKLDKNKEILQHFAKGKVNTSLDIGFKNTSYAYYLESQMTENAASQIHARETAALIAEDNIHVQGSDMAANQVSLLAGKNILLKASENRRTTKSSEKSSGFAITASMGASGLTGVKGYISNGSGKEIEQSIFYAVSHIHADDTVYLSSGNDIVLNGSRVKGTRIMARSKHDLLIKSLQDIHTYESGNKGMYFSVGSGVKSEPERNQKIRKWGSFTAGTGYFSGIVHSDYAGVTDQSGLYSGTGGVDLSIRDKTSLKGSVIDSYGTLDKTRLSTGVLEWEDVENHASYTSRGFGASYNYYSHFKEMSQKEKDEVNYKKGLTPQLSTGSKGKSSSETQSAVSQGYIEISKNKQQTYMLEDLKRNTKNALNKLEEIFDKKEIKKKQELAGLFGKLAYNEIHNMKDSPEKTAMHALVGGIMSWFSNDGFMAGATAATVNKMLIQEIKRASHGDSAKMQWMSAAVGGLVTQMIDKNGQIGAGIASSATKNNYSWKYLWEAVQGTFNLAELYQATKPDSDEYGSEVTDSGIDQEQGAVNTSDGIITDDVSYAEEKSSNVTNLNVTSIEQSEPVGLENREADSGADNYYQGNSEDRNAVSSGTNDSDSNSLTGNTKTYHKSTSYKDALEHGSAATKDEIRDAMGNAFVTYVMVNKMKERFPELPEDYLKTQAEKAVQLGGYATAAISYGYNVYENHQDFKNFHNALQADAWDTLPISGALLNSGMSAILGIGISTEKQVLLGLGIATAINIIIDKEKMELKEKNIREEGKQNDK